MHTIVIAANTRTAESVLRFHALREQDNTYGPRFQEFEPVSAFSATRTLQGAKPDRIIIASDYLRWTFVKPGGLTALWHTIKILRARGTKVVWS